MEENVIQINGAIMINGDVNVKNVMYMKKNYVWNLASCSYETGKYLASIMDNSAIICDEVIESCSEEIKTVPKILNKKKATCKTEN